MDSATQSQPPPPRSTFVNVLAWFFIVFGGLATFVSLIQNLMVQLIVPKAQMIQLLNQAQHAGRLDERPAVLGFLLNHFDLLFFLLLLVSSASLVAAIALLRRKNWARLIFISLMFLGIVWNLCGLAVQFKLYEELVRLSAQTLPLEFEAMIVVMKSFSLIMAVGFSGLFGWIIRKLTSPPIRAEFA